PKDHWDRVSAQGDIRPMRNNPSAMDEMKALLKTREPLYAQAEITVDTSKHSPEESVALIREALADSWRGASGSRTSKTAASHAVGGR
ncbi:MAG TPA: shikimate kinase, partial [Terriglobia bacterium]|nr:shikimate kinase [Terriglobia bacterium]